MESNEFEKANVFSFNDAVEYASGGILSKTVLKKETGNISLFSFAKGEALSEHTAPFDALVYIVDGKSEIIISDKKNMVNKNEMVIMPANKPHSLKAVEKFKMLLIMVRSK